MRRISVPNLPTTAYGSLKRTPPAEAIHRLAEFLAEGNVTVLTGAGVSVDSGIRAYRGHDGRYMNPNYKPILYHELIDGTEKGQLFRQRYWLRAYLGYPSVRDAFPNTTHFALAVLQHTSHISHIITQNVDGLHQKASTYAPHNWISPRGKNDILELHGSLHRVHCKFGHTVTRDVFQHWISGSNPFWRNFFEEMERNSAGIRTNPDGDVDIEHLGINYQDFTVPDCPACMKEHRKNNVHKPEVIFFGESIPTHVKDLSFQCVESGDRLLIVGTTLVTYSAYRLLKHALELRKPVMLLNLGPTRADGVPSLQRLEIASGDVMVDVARALVGSRVIEDPGIEDMLQRAAAKPMSLNRG